MPNIDKMVNDINISIENISLPEIGLMGGQSGLMLYQSFLIQTGFKPSFKTYEIESFVNTINTSLPYHTLASGYAGLLYCSETIEDLELDAETKLALVTYSENIGNIELRKNNFDYLHGYLGISFSLLNSKSAFALSCINQLMKSKKYKNGSVYWTTNNIKGVIDGDLGLAHGAAGVLALLTKFYVKNFDKQNCLNLISEIIQMFRKSKMKGGNSIYGYKLNDPKSSRLAWCYGDLGIAISMWLAGIACNREDWKQEAVDIMLHAAKRRDLQKNGVVDAGICHGTAGIAHIFNRFNRETQLDEFKGATDYWIDQTLKMAKFKDGLAGYKSWQGPEKGWKNEYGLLEGIAGIGLVLHSYLHPEIEPTWDRCLLLS